MAFTLPKHVSETNHLAAKLIAAFPPPFPTIPSIHPVIRHSHPHSPPPPPFFPRSSSSLNLLLHQRLQPLLVRPDHLAHLLSAPEHDEGRHGAHAQLLRHVGQLVDVELVKARGRVPVGHLDDLGRDHFARAAPGRHLLVVSVVVRWCRWWCCGWGRCWIWGVLKGGEGVLWCRWIFEGWTLGREKGAEREKRGGEGVDGMEVDVRSRGS